MIRTDGRNIDQTMGALRGEGALQKVAQIEQPRGKAEHASYYDLPLLKEPVWQWTIPAYFYVGGLAGASAALSAAASLRKDLGGLVRAGRFIAAGGAVLSAGLLIHDLGIRSRFIYMLRVFRPTSPMNLGSWLLTGFGMASGAALLVGSRAAGIAAGLAGLPLSGYTAVLIANTAVPIWQEGRAALPPLFAASAAVSAASAMELIDLGRRERRAVRRMAVIGKAAELAADFALEKAVAKTGEPLHRSPLWKAAKICTAASLVLSLTKRARVLAGILGTAGALATRFAIHFAGKTSSRDPQATFALQRA